MLDLINEILATLQHNKLRTALTGFAVSWGIFLLIVLLSVSRGLVNGMHYMFNQRDTQSVNISGGWAHKPYKGLKDDRPVALLGRDIEVVESQDADFVETAYAEMRGSATISTSKDYLTDGYKGVYPRGLKSDGGTLVEGRFVNEADLRDARRVIVLNTKDVPTLFGEKDPIGQYVKVGDLSFTVVGVYKHEWNRTSYIPFTTARNLAGGSDTIRSMIVRLKNVNTVEEGERTEQELRATLGRLHNFAPDDDSALWIWNHLLTNLKQNTAVGVLELAVWIIGILTLLSGIVGVSNIMFVSVRERTHEIGIKRAIGARPLSILKQIILESVSITTLFGYIGIFFGIIVSQVIAHMTESATDPGGNQILRDPSVNLSIAIEVTVVLIIAGALAGLFPALKSLKIKPVEALRDE